MASTQNGIRTTFGMHPSSSSYTFDKSDHAGSRAAAGARSGTGAVAVAVAAPGVGPSYAFLRPTASATATASASVVTRRHCYCHLCAREPESTTAAPEFHHGPQGSSPFPEDNPGLVVGLETQQQLNFHRSKSGSREESRERNVTSEGGRVASGDGMRCEVGGESRQEVCRVPRRGSTRRVDFYLGPDHCDGSKEDETPGFPTEWDTCYSSLSPPSSPPQSPAQWSGQTTEPCWEHCSCSRDIHLKRDKSQQLFSSAPPQHQHFPHLPPPCCFSPGGPPVNGRCAPLLPQEEVLLGHLSHKEDPHKVGFVEETCWHCVRDYYLWTTQRFQPLPKESPCTKANNWQGSVHRPIPSCEFAPTSAPNHMYRHTRAAASRQIGQEQTPINGHTHEHRTFFSTEVPQFKLQHSGVPNGVYFRPKNLTKRKEPEVDTHKEWRRHEPLSRQSGFGAPSGKHASPSGENNGRPGGNGNIQSVGNGTCPSDSNGTTIVREQIRKVVEDLHEVLGGLKQVHLEMREVVEQIDVLTSNIHIAEDESSQPSHQSQPQLHQQQAVSQEVEVLVHRPAEPQSFPKPLGHSQTNGINGNHFPRYARTPNPNPKYQQTPATNPFTCQSSIKGRGQDIHGDDLPQVTVQKPRTRDNMNGNCLAPRPPRDRVKDAQRRRLELVTPTGFSQTNGIRRKSDITRIATGKGTRVSAPLAKANQNGGLECHPKNLDSNKSTAVILPESAFASNGRQLSTVV